MGTAVPNEELCLKWNDFESILSRSFCEMRDESDFFDVRIACFDDKSTIKTLPAHRVVLSACSPVLKELLRAIGPDGGNKGPLIFLRGIGYHEMEAVLDFMYNGQTKVSHTELDVFLAAAEELKIKGLTTSQEKPSPRKRPAMEATNGTRPSKKKAKNQAVDNVAPGPSTLVEVKHVIFLKVNKYCISHLEKSVSFCKEKFLIYIIFRLRMTIVMLKSTIVKWL